MVLEKNAQCTDSKVIKVKIIIYGRCILIMKAEALMVLEKMHKVLDAPRCTE